MPVVAGLTTPWANVARHVFRHACMGHAASGISSSGGELWYVCRTRTGLTEKFVQVFPKKSCHGNPNELFGQPNIMCLFVSVGRCLCHNPSGHVSAAVCYVYSFAHRGIAYGAYAHV